MDLTKPGVELVIGDAGRPAGATALMVLNNAGSRGR